MFWKSNDAKFAELFKQHCEYLIDAADELKNIFENHTLAESCFQPIFELEHSADETVREIHELLDATFITKIDKLDMGKLIHDMDEVIDCIKETALRIHIYHITTVRKETLRFASIIIAMARGIQGVLNGILNSHNANLIKDQVVAIKRLRKESGQLLHESLEKLHEESDWKTVMQWHNIFELLELITKNSDRVAMTMHSIARKEAL